MKSPPVFVGGPLNNIGPSRLFRNKDAHIVWRKLYGVTLHRRRRAPYIRPRKLHTNWVFSGMLPFQLSRSSRHNGTCDACNKEGDTSGRLLMEDEGGLFALGGQPQPSRALSAARRRIVSSKSLDTCARSGRYSIEQSILHRPLPAQASLHMRCPSVISLNLALAFSAASNH